MAFAPEPPARLGQQISAPFGDSDSDFDGRPQQAAAGPGDSTGGAPLQLLSDAVEAQVLDAEPWLDRAPGDPPRRFNSSRRPTAAPLGSFLCGAADPHRRYSAAADRTPAGAAAQRGRRPSQRRQSIGGSLMPPPPRRSKSDGLLLGRSQSHRRPGGGVGRPSLGMRLTEAAAPSPAGAFFAETGGESDDGEFGGHGRAVGLAPLRPPAVSVRAGRRSTVSLAPLPPQSDRGANPRRLSGATTAVATGTAPLTYEPHEQPPLQQRRRSSQFISIAPPGPSPSATAVAAAAMGAVCMSTGSGRIETLVEAERRVQSRRESTFAEGQQRLLQAEDRSRHRHETATAKKEFLDGRRAWQPACMWSCVLTAHLFAQRMGAVQRVTNARASLRRFLLPALLRWVGRARKRNRLRLACEGSTAAAATPSVAALMADPALKRFGAEHLRHVADRMGRRVFLPGEVMLYPREVPSELVLIAEGEAQATRASRSTLVRGAPPPARSASLLCSRRTSASGEGALLAGSGLSRSGFSQTMPGGLDVMPSATPDGAAPDGLRAGDVTRLRPGAVIGAMGIACEQHSLSTVRVPADGPPVVAFVIARRPFFEAAPSLAASDAAIGELVHEHHGTMMQLYKSAIGPAQLRRYGVLAAVPSRVLEEMRAGWRAETFHPGETVQRAGCQVDCLRLIVHGHVDVVAPQPVAPTPAVAAAAAPPGEAAVGDISAVTPRRPSAFRRDSSILSPAQRRVSGAGAAGGRITSTDGAAPADGLLTQAQALAMLGAAADFPMTAGHRTRGSALKAEREILNGHIAAVVANPRLPLARRLTAHLVLPASGGAPAPPPGCTAKGPRAPRPNSSVTTDDVTPAAASATSCPAGTPPPGSCTALAEAGPWTLLGGPTFVLGEPSDVTIVAKSRVEIMSLPHREFIFPLLSNPDDYGAMRDLARRELAVHLSRPRPGTLARLLSAPVAGECPEPVAALKAFKSEVENMTPAVFCNGDPIIFSEESSFLYIVTAGEVTDASVGGLAPPYLWPPPAQAFFGLPLSQCAAKGRRVEAWRVPRRDVLRWLQAAVPRDPLGLFHICMADVQRRSGRRTIFRTDRNVTLPDPYELFKPADDAPRSPVLWTARRAASVSNAPSRSGSVFGGARSRSGSRHVSPSATPQPPGDSRPPGASSRQVSPRPPRGRRVSTAHHAAGVMSFSAELPHAEASGSLESPRHAATHAASVSSRAAAPSATVPRRSSRRPSRVAADATAGVSGGTQSLPALSRTNSTVSGDAAVRTTRPVPASRAFGGVGRPAEATATLTPRRSPRGLVPRSPRVVGAAPTAGIGGAAVPHGKYLAAGSALPELGGGRRASGGSQMADGTRRASGPAW